MIDDTIKKLNQLVDGMKNYILEDIEDVKKANHEKLLERNVLKEIAIQDISKYKSSLNEQLAKEFQDGVDITKYRDSINNLELNLRELYDLNSRLASIVLPVKEMYKEIIDEITKLNGGNLVEVMA